MILSGDHGALEELYAKFREHPESVTEDWANYFRHIEADGRAFTQAVGGMRVETARPGHLEGKDSAVQALIEAYRRQGHMAADLDPLGMAPRPRTLLELSQYGLSSADFDTVFESHIASLGRRKLRDIVEHMEKTYCGSIGAEHFYLNDNEERLWLQEKMESTANASLLPPYVRLRLFEKLFQAELFEKFLAQKYPGKKRFSLEGGETLICVLDTIVEESGRLGIDQLVLGMAHRGRLNVLVNVMEKPAGYVFAEFEEKYNPAMRDYADVKYHLGYSNEKMTRSGREVGLSLMFNPSHLEAVNPVAMGSVRARQRVHRDVERRQFMPVLIHGDAAFPGQGVVAESLNLMNIPGYTVGGTFHIVINNQIGFTTLPPESRSTHYATDLAKGFQIPIFHVNADDPEAVYRVVELSMEYRHRFQKDVIIDLICYRRLGHNENDEPAFTQPLMYDRIKQHPTTVEVYEQRLLQHTDVTAEDIGFIKNGSRAGLEASFKRARDTDVKMKSDALGGRWSRFTMDALDSEPQTKLLHQQLDRVAAALFTIPQGFGPHPKLVKLIETRSKMYAGTQPIDWGCAEALAFGSILENGFDVRLSGQDAERGTFSHRHSVLVDVTTQKKWTPLQSISDTQGRFEVINSPLSEYSVLGFEYGYSLSDPNALVIWEAQFGDFANGAQIMIDQFITSSEVKWLRMSGLVMLLPHGYEGQGPEHSSARLERFLQLCASNNIQVCNCTTPAQYFHLLRRQMLRNFRKPLVITSPKSLLRHPEAVSNLEDIGLGIFRELLFDHTVKDPASVNRLLFCSGHIYYDLIAEKKKRASDETAVIRIEQLYPFPHGDVVRALEHYANAKEFLWVQEEPENMGAWDFLDAKLAAIPGMERVGCVARPESPSPAAGLFKLHAQELEKLVQTSFGPL
ncbi:MAG: 2-oxoglutarate dehydrogenase E1 component [Spirochaetia bacterium]|nr:2-oxoglutarate dehydrogenase E1 component [Spirochaetia bacterium]